jgi:hypothetical protein
MNLVVFQWPSVRCQSHASAKLGTASAYDQLSSGEPVIGRPSTHRQIDDTSLASVNHATWSVSGHHRDGRQP